MKRIVIIGGMGPQASLHLHQRIIAGAAKQGARRNDEYPLILHLSVPVKDFISDHEVEAALNLIKRHLKTIKLEQNDQVLIACNTAHLLKNELEKFTGVKFISLIDQTIDSLNPNIDKTIGLIASPTTINSGLYTDLLRDKGHRFLTCDIDDLRVVEKCIRQVIANKQPDIFTKSIDPVIDKLHAQGANKIILGCTELSLIYSNDSNNYVIDPLEVVKEYLLNGYKSF